MEDLKSLMTDHEMKDVAEIEYYELKNQIPALIAKWENIIGVTVSDWGVKQMKTKWGTCNIEEKRIWVNLELAKKPTHCLEYIVVHEMIHLLERHHNDRFLAYLDKFLPKWKFYKEELNRLAKEVLQSDKMTILVVGDKDKIKANLEKLGYKIV